MTRYFIGSCVVLTLMFGFTLSGSARQFQQRLDPQSSGMERLVEETIKAVHKIHSGRPRIAIFAFGNKSGGRPEKYNPAITEIEVKFHSILRTAIANKGFILGSDGIENELRARQLHGVDLATLNPAKPNNVSDWLKKCFEGNIEVAVFARVDEYDIELTIIGVNAKTETVKGDFGWGNFFYQGRGELTADDNLPMIRPDLFAVLLHENGSTSRHRIPMFRSKDKDSDVTIALIPDDPKEIAEALSNQKLFLEIDLIHTGKIPDRSFLELDEKKQFSLANDPTRLFPVAVTIEGRGTISQEVPDYRFPNDPGKKRRSFVYDTPAMQRKWIMANPQYVVVEGKDKKGFGVGERSINPKDIGHGKITVRGYQKDNNEASLFLMRKPDEGCAEKIGVSASTGLIRITAFAQRKSIDQFTLISPTSVGAGGMYGKVGIDGGIVIQNKVVVLKVPHYSQPIEEHIIQLSTKSRHDPTKGNLFPYLPQAITP